MKKGVEIKDEVSVQDALRELVDDIDFLLQKAELGIKGKIGSPAVRQFLREVKTKVKSMLANIKESSLRKRAEGLISIIESLGGTFEDITDKVRAAVIASGLFPERVGEQMASGPYVRFMFLDRCIISYQGNLYEVAYSLIEDVVVLGTPKEVVETYVVKEAATFAAREIDTVPLKESAYEITTPGAEQDIVTDFVSLKEAKYDEATGEFDNVVLIEAGTNEAKRRHYTNESVKEAAPGFAGLKMYLNHLSDAEEAKNPIRDLKDWMSTIVHSEPGVTKDGRATARAKIAVHSPWLRTMLKDSIFREHVGLSINTGGRVAFGKIDGKEMQLVEQIIFARKNGPCSVDWVTEAGARGHVARLMESVAKEENKGMELKDLTIVQLREGRADLVKEIETKSGVEKVALETQLQEANKKIANMEKDSKSQALLKEVDALLKDAKIPDATKAKIRKRFETDAVEKDVKESVAASIKEEMEYLNSVSKTGKIKLNGGEGDVNLKEGLQDQLDSRAGVKEESKK